MQRAPFQPVDAMNEPAGQSEQRADIGQAENVPAAHDTHACTDVWPGNPLLVPASSNITCTQHTRSDNNESDDKLETKQAIADAGVTFSRRATQTVPQATPTHTIQS